MVGGTRLHRELIQREIFQSLGPSTSLAKTTGASHRQDNYALTRPSLLSRGTRSVNTADEIKGRHPPACRVADKDCDDRRTRLNAPLS